MSQVTSNVTVIVRDDNFEKAFAIFKKKMKRGNVMKTLLENRYYEKPSEKRRKAKMKAITRLKYAKLLEKE